MQGRCPGNHLFVLKYFIWLNENIILFDIFFIKGLVKGRLTNENNKRTIADAEIFDNRNGPQVGYDQALYPRPHDIYWGTKVWNIEINFVFFKKQINR